MLEVDTRSKVPARALCDRKPFEISPSWSRLVVVVDMVVVILVEVVRVSAVVVVVKAVVEVPVTAVIVTVLVIAVSD